MLLVSNSVKGLEIIPIDAEVELTDNAYFFDAPIYWAECAESWSCSDWSACSSGTQTRTCTDSNGCGTNSSRPDLSQFCALSPGGGGVGTPPPLSANKSQYNIVALEIEQGKTRRAILFASLFLGAAMILGLVYHKQISKVTNSLVRQTNLNLLLLNRKKGRRK